jgi:hypothetical protein
MKKIDLSKISHRELPTKKIKLEIGQEIQEVDIVPINGRGLTSLGLISEDDLDKNAKLCLIALMYGLKLTQEEAELFMNSDTVAADSAAAEILNFTKEYQNEINTAKDEIKKNIKKAITK